MTITHPRDLPSLGSLWEGAPCLALRERFGDPLTRAALREELERSRQRLLAGKSVDLSLLLPALEKALSPSWGRVLNGTGTVLHTNLGRAPLGEALRAVAQEMDGYSALEYDLQEGRRGRRGEQAERYLRWLTGSPAALVVNNCAAAMILLLTAHARDREVIVSRGELVEIGGGFRIPDILAMSGARLVEVGTTNRTRIEDYRRAITESTGLLLTTHSSNFRMVGFTQAPSSDELLALGQESGVPVAYDLGSGMLTPTVDGEPSVAQAARFPLCAFSGDKLLGGPQCGILLGRADLIESCRRHPLYRALRCDKLTLALLEEVLRRHSADPESLSLLAAFRTPLEALKERAEALTGALQPAWLVQAVASRGQVGGGSLPGEELDSWALHLTPPPGLSVDDLHRRLRNGRPAVVGRVERGSLVFDLKALPAEHDSLLLRALAEVSRETYSSCHGESVKHLQKGLS